MTHDDENKKGSRERFLQLKTVRSQVKRALEEVEEKPKSEHSQETINRLRASLEKINNDLLAEQKALGGGTGGDMDLEMMDLLLEIDKDKNNPKK